MVNRSNNLKPSFSVCYNRRKNYGLINEYRVKSRLYPSTCKINLVNLLKRSLCYICGCLNQHLTVMICNSLSLKRRKICLNKTGSAFRHAIINKKNCNSKKETIDEAFCVTWSPDVFFRAQCKAARLGCKRLERCCYWSISSFRTW